MILTEITCFHFINDRMNLPIKPIAYDLLKFQPNILPTHLNSSNLRSSILRIADTMCFQHPLLTWKSQRDDGIKTSNRPRFT